MKRIMCIVLSAVLIVSLSGCGKFFKKKHGRGFFGHGGSHWNIGK